MRKTQVTDSFESEIDVEELFNENEGLDFDILKVHENLYKVSGEKIKKMLGTTNLDTEKGMNYFQKFIKDKGIVKELKKIGMVEGDTVDIEGIEFTYYD